MDEKDKKEYIILANGKKINKKTWIMATLRRASYRWPAINEAERLARRERGLYECAMCNQLYRRGEYAKDHVEPVIPFTGFPIHPITGGPDWTIVIDRLLCDIENFQILCHSCHDQKSAIEDAMRANHNANLKEIDKKQKKEEKLKKKLEKSKKV